MAGAISEVARQSLATDFRRIDPTAARIVLIEAGPRIMPNSRRIYRITFEVMSATRVMSCDEHGVDLEHGRPRCRYHYLGCRRGGVAGGALA
jgi:NADH dehydrogenase